MSYEQEMEQREDPAYHAYQECMATEVKPRQERIEQLEAELATLKERLPKNADGDAVLWGDTVWFDDEGKAIWGVVDTFEDIRDVDIKGEFNLLGWMPDEEIPFQSPNIYCYSTAESCRKSIEGSETK